VGWQTAGLAEADLAGHGNYSSPRGFWIAGAAIVTGGGGE
jgi:hypothetical protein